MTFLSSSERSGGVAVVGDGVVPLSLVLGLLGAVITGSSVVGVLTAALEGQLASALEGALAPVLEGTLAPALEGTLAAAGCSDLVAIAGFGAGVEFLVTDCTVDSVLVSFDVD